MSLPLVKILYVNTRETQKYGHAHKAKQLPKELHTIMRHQPTPISQPKFVIKQINQQSHHVVTS